MAIRSDIQSFRGLARNSGLVIQIGPLGERPETLDRDFRAQKVEIPTQVVTATTLPRWRTSLLATQC